MLEQGNQFYTKLNEILMKLQQSVSDYKVGRDLQKNDILTANAKGGPGGGGAPPGMPPAGGAPGFPMQMGYPPQQQPMGYAPQGYP
jgi:hypothetical protein